LCRPGRHTRPHSTERERDGNGCRTPSVGANVFDRLEGCTFEEGEQQSPALVVEVGAANTELVANLALGVEVDEQGPPA